jgi:hypothetical protein
MSQRTQIIINQTNARSGPSWGEDLLTGIGLAIGTLFALLFGLMLIMPFIPRQIPPWGISLNPAEIRSEVANGGVVQLRLVEINDQAPQYVACASQTSGWCTVIDRYYLLAMYRSGFKMIAELPAATATPNPDDYGPPAVFAAGSQNTAMSDYETAVRAWLSTHGPEI